MTTTTPMTDGELMEVAQRVDRARARSARQSRDLPVIGADLEARIAGHHLAPPDPGTRFLQWSKRDRDAALAEMREAYLEHVMTTDAADLA